MFMKKEASSGRPQIKGPGGSIPAVASWPTKVEASAPGDEVLCSFLNVTKSYDGKSPALSNFNLDIRKGELITCLGPSGSGKTTALMLLAGFQAQEQGEIYFRGQPISQVSPHRRNFGVVFQSYALFPHMTVAENILFPLKMRRTPRDEANRKLDRALGMIRMSEFAHRKPDQLSGGQQQRVALARALVFEPELVLLDEPLAALDKSLREELQFEIRELHEALGITMLYVTHDQGEALTLSDRIAVFRDGKVEQVSSPINLYNKPETRFVAGFIGQMNMIPAKVDQAADGVVYARTHDGRRVSGLSEERFSAGDSCLIAVRPEWLRVGEAGDREGSLAVHVQDIVFQGSSLTIRGVAGDRTPISISSHPGVWGSVNIGEVVTVA